MHKVGGAQPPRFQVGGARAPKAPPRSYAPGKEVYIFLVDAVPIGLQDLKYILFFGGGNAYKFSNNLWRIFRSMHKVEGAQPPSFQVGGLEPPQPPRLLRPCHTFSYTGSGSMGQFSFLRFYEFSVFQFFGFTVFQFLSFCLNASFLISEHTYIHIHPGISPSGPVACYVHAYRICAAGAVPPPSR